MWVVVGLGNPGPTYAQTRHNVGFMVIERLAQRWDVDLRLDPDGRVRRGQGVYAGQVAVLIQPLTYMNRSGEVLDAVAAADEVIAITDDLDLPEGRLRIRARGGAGGHRGVASLIDRLGEGFTRIRIGVGRPPAGVDAADYVLAPLTTDVKMALEVASNRACEAIELIMTEGREAAMGRFNATPEHPAQSS